MVFRLGCGWGAVGRGFVIVQAGHFPSPVARQEMPVDCQREGGAVMTELLLNVVQLLAGGDQQARVGMPLIVNA